MANEELSPSEIEQLRRVFQAAALNDFPNPDRKGCPTDKSVLRAMAAKTLPLNDPAWHHSANCSPCFRELKQYEAELKRPRLRWAAVLAPVALIIVGLFLFKGQLFQPSPSSVQTATLDLRPFSVTRGEPDQANEAGNGLVLSRGDLTLTILLPFGFEPGRYEFKLLNDSLQQAAAGSGDAKLQNPEIMLTARIDTSKLVPGRFTLWLRQSGHDWKSYRLSIR